MIKQAGKARRCDSNLQSETINDSPTDWQGKLLGDAIASKNKIAILFHFSPATRIHYTTKKSNELNSSSFNKARQIIITFFLKKLQGWFQIASQNKFMSTIRCSIPQYTRIQSTYSIAVLHPSEMAFLNITLGKH